MWGSLGMQVTFAASWRMSTERSVLIQVRMLVHEDFFFQRFSVSFSRHSNGFQVGVYFQEIDREFGLSLVVRRRCGRLDLTALKDSKTPF